MKVYACTYVGYVIVQTRVGGRFPISKYREEFKIQGEAGHFKRNLRSFLIGGNPPYECLNAVLKRTIYGLIYVISSSDFQTLSTVLIFVLVCSLMSFRS